MASDLYVFLSILVRVMRETRTLAACPRPLYGDSHVHANGATRPCQVRPRAGPRSRHSHREGIARRDRRGSHRRAPAPPARRAPAHPARRAGRTGLYPGRQCCAHCPGAEPVARRGARRADLLPPLPHAAGGPPCAGSVPGRILSGHGGRAAGRACPPDAGLRFPRHHGRRRRVARTRILPGAVRPISGHHAGRTAACASDGGQTRPLAGPCRTRQRSPAMSTPVTVYLPRDAAALAMDADAVALAIAQEAARRGLAVNLVRNGSRGLLWLEPLAEVATSAGRIAYGPVRPEDVPGLFDAGWLQGGAHPLCHGPTQEISYLKNQQRLTFARAGITDPLSLQDYAAHEGLQGVRRALSLSPQQIVDEIIESGLRGRGGAAFPTGIKWKTVLGTPSDQKYIVCNADEGDSGTFSDRLIMEGDPYVLIEGMIIAGLAVGATYGYIYVRSEYPHAIATLNAAIERARAAGWLGSDIQGSGRGFDLEVRKGAGAYIC